MVSISIISIQHSTAHPDDTYASMNEEQRATTDIITRNTTFDRGLGSMTFDR